MDVSELLPTLITAAQAEYGEPEYAYYKVPHRWSQSRTSSGRPRNDGGYCVSVTSKGEPISKEEYDANIAQGKKDHLDAFMGRRKGMSYDTYERELTRQGWRERLIDAISKWQDDPLVAKTVEKGE